MDYTNCRLCPRECGVNRAAGETGFCGCPATALVAKTMRHMWEEPVLAGSGGSGALFFGGCTLGCKYCQNAAISGGPVGTARGFRRTAPDFRRPDRPGGGEHRSRHPHPLSSHHPACPGAQAPGAVVCNCGGYERVETLRELEGKIDIYLPDFKYADSALAADLSGAPDYFPRAQDAIREMVRQTGAPQWQGDKLLRGTVIRHLILPGHVDNSLRVLDWIGETFAPGQVLVSLMRQYTPMGNLPAPFDRRVTEEEYQAVLSWMYLNDLEGFTQEAESADRGFIPDF